jgi:hypothetical protein
MNHRYHITMGDKRTTVSLDNFLSILLALRLGVVPGTPEAIAAVRTWLQTRIDAVGDYKRCRTSQWLQTEVVHHLVAPELLERYYAWERPTWDNFVSVSSPPTALATGQKTR